MNSAPDAIRLHIGHYGASFAAAAILHVHSQRLPESTALDEVRAKRRIWLWMTKFVTAPAKN
jgi:hypothetical protein